MEEHLRNSNCCKCEHCIEDIMCISLNSLPPKYVTTSKGELFSKIDQQMDRQNMLDIDVAVINALEYVGKRPRHG